MLVFKIGESKKLGEIIKLGEILKRHHPQGLLEVLPF